MGKVLKYIFFIALLAVIAFAIWRFRSFFSPPQANVIESKEVIVERMEKVNKLITLEAYYSEVYDYKDYYYYDFSPFRKKALIRIKAKVSVGYDFKKIHMVADEETKTVTIFGFPEPEILSIDHDLDYYDLTQGTFNTFTEADYNKMNKNAKDFIREKAKDKEVFQQAAEKKDELIEMLKWMLDAAGWTLSIDGSPKNVKIPTN